MKAGKAEKSDNCPVRVLLVVTDPVARDFYCRELASCRAEVMVVEKLFPLSEEMAQQRFNGLLFDVKAKMGEIRFHKAEVYRLTSRFPTANLQVDIDRQTIRLFHPGPGGEKSLADFIEKRCCHSPALKILNAPRKELHLPVLLSVGEAKPRARKVVTRDFSPGGCFLVSYQKYQIGRKVRLLFSEFDALGPLTAEVRSVVIWGQDRQLPGIGVRFLELTPEQEEMLNQLYERLW